MYEAVSLNVWSNRVSDGDYFFSFDSFMHPSSKSNLDYEFQGFSLCFIT